MSTLDPLSIDGVIENEKVRANLERWRDQINFIIAHRFGDTKSSTIGAGVGSVRMGTANAATNTQWLPMVYEGTTFWIPAWLTNAP